MTVAGQSEPLEKEVALEEGDFETATITATRGGVEFTAFNDNQLKELTSSSGTSGIQQIRIKGEFPVGTKGNPVVYTVTVTKKVTFNESYKDIPVTLSATFNYWDSANDCPPIEQNKTAWGSGSFISASGLDFTLGEGSSSMGSLSLQKSVVNETGGTIEIEGSYSFDVYAYDSETNQGTKKATLTVPVRNGIGTSFVYLPYGDYYIEENEPSTAITDYTFNKVVIDDAEAQDRRSLVFTLGSSLVSKSFSVENVYASNVTSVTVSKVWDDDDDQDGIRPDSVTVSLWKGNEDTGKTLTLNAGNNWTGTFTDLDRYGSDGNEIKYTVKENAVNGYASTVTGEATKGFVITNTHTPATVDVSGTKTWNDDNDKDGKRPDSIKVNLLADGDVIASVTVTAADNWAYSFANLPKYANGKEIVYTISEDEVEGYTSKTEGYNIINTLVPEDPEPDPQPSTDPDDGDDEGDSDDPKPLPKADSTPKTGDSTPMAPLALIACAAVALAAFALPAARRRK